VLRLQCPCCVVVLAVALYRRLRCCGGYDEFHQLGYLAFVELFFGAGAVDAGHYDEVEGRDDYGVLAEVAFEPEAAGWEDVVGVVGRGEGVGRPPEVAVAARFGVGVWMGGGGDPVGWDDLGAVPVAVVEIEQGEAGEVTGGHAHGVGGVFRFSPAGVEAVGGAEVLHADGAADLLLEGGEDGLVGGLLVDATEGVEVPVVVVPEGAGSMGAAVGAFGFHAFGFVDRLVVDAAAGFQQHANGGLFFLRREGGWDVVDVELREGVVKVDLSLGDGDADECGEEALAAGVELGAVVDLAAGGDDDAVLDEHDAGDGEGFEVVFDALHAVEVPAGGGGSGVGPVGGGEGGSLGARGEGECKERGGEDRSHRAIIAPARPGWVVDGRFR
jgi:hypothetical protein